VGAGGILCGVTGRNEASPISRKRARSDSRAKVADTPQLHAAATLRRRRQWIARSHSRNGDVRSTDSGIAAVSYSVRSVAEVIVMHLPPGTVQPLTAQALDA
jgi:hypothetical protein